MNTDDMKNLLAVRLAGGLDGATLAGVAAGIVDNNVHMVSAHPKDIATLWAWLEKTDVKIIARQDTEDKIQDIENISGKINTLFKQGAYGVQIDLPLAVLGDFCAELSPIRDDLFFNRDLIIGLDINEIDADGWENVFENLHDINATAVMLRGSDEQFVGRVYAALEYMHSDFDMDVYFELIDTNRIEQVYRLVEKMRPELLNRLRFFIG